MSKFLLGVVLTIAVIVISAALSDEYKKGRISSWTATFVAAVFGFLLIWFTPLGGLMLGKPTILYLVFWLGLWVFFQLARYVFNRRFDGSRKSPRQINP